MGAERPLSTWEVLSGPELERGERKMGSNIQSPTNVRQSVMSPSVHQAPHHICRDIIGLKAASALQ